jgi:hypothetical protein
MGRSSRSCLLNDGAVRRRSGARVDDRRGAPVKPPAMCKPEARTAMGRSAPRVCLTGKAVTREMGAVMGRVTTGDFDGTTRQRGTR